MSNGSQGGIYTYPPFGVCYFLYCSIADSIIIISKYLRTWCRVYSICQL